MTVRRLAGHLIELRGIPLRCNSIKRRVLQCKGAVRAALMWLAGLWTALERDACRRCPWAAPPIALYGSNTSRRVCALPQVLNRNFAASVRDKREALTYFRIESGASLLVRLEGTMHA